MPLDLDGVIASAGFASGDRFVCGLWRASPVGVLHRRPSIVEVRPHLQFPTPVTR